MSNTTMMSENLQSSADTGDDHPILYFDGVCGLCNRSVDFVMRHDPAGQFRFAPLQGETASTRLPAADVADLNTMVLSADGKIYRKSAAAVRILWRLGGVWRVLGAMLWLIPAPLRNLCYSGVAAVRYRLFGKHDTCRLPTPEERERFLP